MNKTGNQHSSLLDSLLKSAEKVRDQEQPKTELADQIFSALKAKQQVPTLKEVLAGVMSQSNTRTKIVANGVRKTAQFDDPALTEPAAPPGGELGGELGGDLPEGGMPETETCDPELKNKIRDAFIAACGGVEQAHQCLDESGGLGEEMGEPDTDLGGEMGMEDDLGGLEAEEPEMPAPMPMEMGTGQPPMA